MEPPQIEIPEKIPSIVSDFTRDLSFTFPEYSHLWSQWTVVESCSSSQLTTLVLHLSSVFPERFFDILYQNEDIFKANLPDAGVSQSQESSRPKTRTEKRNEAKQAKKKGGLVEPSTDEKINVEFLPGVDFRILWNSDGVSETTKTAIWKYLQLILVNILGSVKNKMNFGETADLFEGVDEKALQEKLSETVDSISEFFNCLGGDARDGDMTEEDTDAKHGGIGEGEETGAEGAHNNIPSGEELHDHLNGIFKGKIGSLAKELAEEISTDMKHLFEEDGENDVRTTQDLLKKMLRNPKKIMEIMRTIGDKLNKKMKDGDINEEDIMKEATEVLGKMKGLGGKQGMGQFAELFKTMGKGMGMDTKNMKMNMGALGKMQNKFMTKDRMMQKLEQRRAARESAAAAVAATASAATTASHPPSDIKYNITSINETPNKKNMVFSIDGEEKQECSSDSVKQDLDELVAMINGTSSEPVKKPSGKSGKKKR